MSDNTTCEQLIDEKLRHRLDDLAVLLRATVGEYVKHDDEKRRALGLEDDASEDDASVVLREYGLGIYSSDDEEGRPWHARVELSTGGPADRFDLYPSAAGTQLERIEYHYVDWFDHAERVVDDPEDVGIITDIYGEYVVYLLDLYRNMV